MQNFWKGLSRRLTVPIIAGISVYVYLTLLILYLKFHVPGWAYLLTFLPITVAVGVAAYVSRQQQWKNLVAQRTVTLLQVSGALLIARSLASLTTSFAPSKLDLHLTQKSNVILQF